MEQGVAGLRPCPVHGTRIGGITRLTAEDAGVRIGGTLHRLDEVEDRDRLQADLQSVTTPRPPRGAHPPLPNEWRHDLRKVLVGGAEGFSELASRHAITA